MRRIMNANIFEKDLIIKFFELRQIYSKPSYELLDKVEVLSRDYTGVGFYTSFEKHECLKVADSKINYIWAYMGAFLNKEKINVGFVFYIKDGYLEMIEGYSYGEQTWPDHIESYDIFELRVKNDGGN